MNETTSEEEVQQTVMEWNNVAIKPYEATVPPRSIIH